MERMSALSTQDVLLPVKVKVADHVIDVTTDEVRMAIVAPGGQPVPLDWQDADWEVDTVTGKTYAKLLVGPAGGAVTLTPGRWHAWIEITDNPEVPIIDGGPLEVY